MLTIGGRFASKDQAESIANHVRVSLVELGQIIDLSALDGVTIATDYRDAVSKIDLGHTKGDHPVPTEEDFGSGAAMTISVERNGEYKSHIVLSTLAVSGFDTENEAIYRDSFCTVVHECAHVEINAKLLSAFPEFLTPERYGNSFEQIKWGHVLPCWNEFAASWITSNVAGSHSLSGNEEIFLEVLQKARPSAISKIKAYRSHGDLWRIVSSCP